MPSKASAPDMGGRGKQESPRHNLGLVSVQNLVREKAPRRGIVRHGRKDEEGSLTIKYREFPLKPAMGGSGTTAINDNTTLNNPTILVGREDHTKGNTAMGRRGKGKK